MLLLRELLISGFYCIGLYFDSGVSKVADSKYFSFKLFGITGPPEFTEYPVNFGWNFFFIGSEIVIPI